MVKIYEESSRECGNGGSCSGVTRWATIKMREGGMLTLLKERMFDGSCLDKSKITSVNCKRLLDEAEAFLNENTCTCN